MSQEAVNVAHLVEGRPSVNDTVMIDARRIKRLETSYAVWPDMPEDKQRAAACDWIGMQLGREISAKLFEFSKFSKEPGTLDGSIVYSAHIDIIVPNSQRSPASSTALSSTQRTSTSSCRRSRKRIWPK